MWKIKVNPNQPDLTRNLINSNLFLTRLKWPIFDPQPVWLDPNLTQPARFAMSSFGLENVPVIYIFFFNDEKVHVAYLDNIIFTRKYLMKPSHETNISLICGSHAKIHVIYYVNITFTRKYLIRWSQETNISLTCGSHVKVHVICFVNITFTRKYVMRWSHETNISLTCGSHSFIIFTIFGGDWLWLLVQYHSH